MTEVLNDARTGWGTHTNVIGIDIDPTDWARQRAAARAIESNRNG